MINKRSMQEQFDHCYEMAKILKPTNCYNYAGKFSKHFVGRNVWSPIRTTAVMVATLGRTKNVSDLTENELKEAKKIADQLIQRWYYTEKAKVN